MVWTGDRGTTHTLDGDVGGTGAVGQRLGERGSDDTSDVAGLEGSTGEDEGEGTAVAVGQVAGGAGVGVLALDQRGLGLLEHELVVGGLLHGGAADQVLQGSHVDGASNGGAEDGEPEGDGGELHLDGCYLEGRCLNEREERVWKTVTPEERQNQRAAAEYIYCKRRRFRLQARRTYGSRPTGGLITFSLSSRTAAKPPRTPGSAVSC